MQPDGVLEIVPADLLPQRRLVPFVPGEDGTDDLERRLAAAGAEQPNGVDRDVDALPLGEAADIEESDRPVDRGPGAGALAGPATPLSMRTARPATFAEDRRSTSML